jgi:hypothetical protein
MKTKMIMFNLRDTVQVKRSGNLYAGMLGKIVAFANNKEQAIGVEFENKTKGMHDCGGKGKDGRCYYFNYTSIFLVKKHNETK